MYCEQITSIHINKCKFILLKYKYLLRNARDYIKQYPCEYNGRKRGTFFMFLSGSSGPFIQYQLYLLHSKNYYRISDDFCEIQFAQYNCALLEYMCRRPTQTIMNKHVTWLNLKQATLFHIATENDKI